MQNLMNFGKQAYSEYQASQQGHQGQGGGQFGVEGSAALNSSDNNRPPQTGMPFDPSEAVQHASNASSHADSALFGQAMSFLNNQFDGRSDDLDEDEAVKAHEQAYNSQGASQLGSKPMGAAAAMQALKMFTSGNSDQSMASSSGGTFQTKLVAQAMAEAAKLFDQKGGAAGGADKQSVVQSAAETMMKLMLKNKVSGMMGAGSEGGSAMGGGGAGGMSQLFSMAQQFMK